MTPHYYHLLPPSWKSQVSAWLDEDTPSFDYGGFVVGETSREAFLLGKGSRRTVLAGTPFVDEIFRLLDCTYAPTDLINKTDARLLTDFVIPGYSVQWHVEEGDEFEPIKHIATVRGKARYLLLGERVSLNLLARCSGIATTCAGALFPS
jgi:nicotinate-nucleotide pyrophosphorylase (carboxylating)